jgi:tripartite-type tricarboxylate transporter receptor subunit TctC
VKDFESVALLCDVPNILIVNNDVPVKSVQEFIGMAKAQPGKVNYGSSGNGSSMHLTGAQFQAATKVDIVHVPYRGSPAATADLLAGQIQAMFHQVPTVIGQVKQGQFRPLAVTSAQRVPALPEVPTMSESGLPGFTSTTWYGISAPAKTPKPVVDRLNKEINAVLASEKDKIEATGVGVRIASPEEMTKVLIEDIARWREIVNNSGAKLD